MSHPAGLPGSDNKLTIDDVTTVVFTPAMGARLAIARMKLMIDQREIGTRLGISQAAVSRLELGQAKVVESVLVATWKRVLPQLFPYVLFGTNEERFNRGKIVKAYWDNRLRIRRKNKSAYSRGRD